MQILALEHFAGLLNETFNVAIDHEGVSPFVLVEVQPLPVHGHLPQGVVRSPISLLFRHQSVVLFPQKIYQMSHAALGEFGIFLVPIARDRDGFIYQALFS